MKEWMQSKHVNCLKKPIPKGDSNVIHKGVTWQAEAC